MEAWRSLQSAKRGLRESLFFPGIHHGGRHVRDDVRVVVIENDGRPVGFFPHQRSFLGFGKAGWRTALRLPRVIANPAANGNRAADVRSGPWRRGYSITWSTGGGVRRACHDARRVAADRFSAGFERYMRRPRRGSASRGKGLARKLGTRNRHARLHSSRAGYRRDGAVDPMEERAYRRSGSTDGFAASWTGALLRRISE